MQVTGTAMTLGDSNRIRKQNTDKEIDTLVEDGTLTAEEAVVIKLDPANPSP